MLASIVFAASEEQVPLLSKPSQLRIRIQANIHERAQLDELRSYLSNNYRLPPFAAVTAVDSRYVEAIQIADLALRMFRRQRLQANPGWAGLDLSFIRATDVSSSHETGEK